MFDVNVMAKNRILGLVNLRTLLVFSVVGVWAFDHDPNYTSKLLYRHFSNAIDKVLKINFKESFNEAGLIIKEDFLNMSIIYLISTFILSSSTNIHKFQMIILMC